MKLSHTYFSSLRNSEFWFPIATLSLFGVGVWVIMTFTGAQEFLLRHSDVFDYMCCLLAAVLVGYTAVVGILSGPEDTVTVETQENMSKSIEKRYLKI